MRQKYLVLLVGIPGSGKSTFGKNLIFSGLPHPQTHYICPDDIRAELSGDANNQKVSEEAWNLAYSRLDHALSEGDDVVFDAVLVNPKTRRRLRQIAKQHNAQVVYVIVDTPLDIAKKRNQERGRKVPDDVIENFHKRFDSEFFFIKKDKGEFI